MLELFLDIAHGVIAEIAGQTAAKARHARRDRHLEALLIGGDEVQRIAAGGFDHLTIGHDFGPCLVTEARRTHKTAGRQTDEAVAAESFTTHHRLQQEAVLAVTTRMGQLEVEGKRGFEVGKSLAQQRDAVIALGRKRFEFQFRDHGRSSGSHGAWPAC